MRLKKDQADTPPPKQRIVVANAKLLQLFSTLQAQCDDSHWAYKFVHNVWYYEIIRDPMP